MQGEDKVAISDGACGEMQPGRQRTHHLLARHPLPLAALLALALELGLVLPLPLGLVKERFVLPPHPRKVTQVLRRAVRIRLVPAGARVEAGLGGVG